MVPQTVREHPRTFYNDCLNLDYMRIIINEFDARSVFKLRLKAPILSHNFICLGKPFHARSPHCHDGVIKWKHFPRYWPFVRGIHRSPMNSPQKGPWRGALMSSLICFWMNGWINNHEAGDLRRHRTHYDVIVMRNTTCKKYRAWMLDPSYHMSYWISGNISCYNMRTVGWYCFLWTILIFLVQCRYTGTEGYDVYGLELG